MEQAQVSHDYGAIAQRIAEKYEVLHYSIANDVEPDARKIRDRKAKELRSQGWKVECKRERVVLDLSKRGFYVYSLLATRKKDGGG